MARDTVAACALAAICGLVSWVILWTHTSDLAESPRARRLQANMVISVLAMLATYRLIPQCEELFISARLFGRDLNKALPEGTTREQAPKVPESLGTIAACVYLIAMFFFFSIHFHSFITEEVEQDKFPYAEFVEYMAALLSICCMIFLGFADDVLNLRWRHKFVLPAIATLPLLIVYCVTFNSTTIIVPMFLRSLLGISINLGGLYYLYMGMLAVFCTNAINILAGINGVEAGQSLVIAISVLIHNWIQVESRQSDHQNHFLSIMLVTPFAGVCAGLLYHNWYPSRVFVGDTFCYFAGMTFAVAGILSHFSKTMLLFFIPQVLNFVISLPQLFHIVLCPRHRLPKLDEKTGKLNTSKACFKLDTVGKLGSICLAIFSGLGLVSYKETKAEDGSIDVEVSNFTLINVFLRIFGPTHEETLTIYLLVFQMLCSGLAFVIRYRIALYFYEGPDLSEEDILAR